MGDFIAASSVYTFSDNPRFFKANDPYYFEVDNIPLKQLSENTNWLKDQLTGKSKTTGIGREDFDELRPFVEGDSRVVKVKPGRFTARINDGYDITPQQFFIQAAGQLPAAIDTFKLFALNSGDVILGQIIDQFKTQLAANAQNMNGLSERAFTYPVADSDNAATNSFVAGFPSTKGVGLDDAVWPISEILLWVTGKSKADYTHSTWNKNLRDAGHLELSRLETEFSKKWRGTARTSVVDVPEELSITIPKFNADDYFYIDENGVKVSLNSDQRIDLLFIYSKPIDASAVTVAKYQGGSPTKLTKPELGIVLGAGLSVNYKEVDNNITKGHVVIGGIDSEGRSKILADVSDEANSDNGFSGINVHGSFPSPDDLMNLAPLLSYKLESTNLALVGQSILPVAYIVTTSTATGAILTQSNIIDIRPFFRTTELAFNERTGIAAAMPQLSYANPAVGKAQMDQELFRLDEKIQDQLATITGGSEQTTPRVVAAGHIFGGFNFGAEGAYKDFINKSTNTTLTLAELKRQVKIRQGLADNFPIPDYPDWDTAKWLDQGSFSEKGTHVNDYINTFVRLSTGTVDYGSSDNTLSIILDSFGTDNINGIDNLVNMHFVKKTVSLNRSAVPWMSDYLVEVELLNCIPLSCRANGFNSDTPAAAAGVWVEKSKNSFTIYVAWVANDQGQLNPGATEKPKIPVGHKGNAYPFNNRDGHWFSGFAVINQEIMNAVGSSPIFLGQATAGVATYPSVAFSVVGIPGSFPGYGESLSGRTPVLTLA